MDFLDILKEGRVDDFKNKFKDKFTPENINQLVSQVQPKYLNWVGKVFDNINFDQNIKRLIDSLNYFTKISSNLAKTDINQYVSFGELVNELNEYDTKVRRNVKKVKGGNIVYEDNRFFVVNPLTYEASCYYGKGTKWCTAADTNYQFNKYNEDGKLFYILDKTKKTNDDFYKVALLKKFDGTTIFYDAKDKETKMIPNIMGEEKFAQIISSVDKYLESEYGEQLKIFRDKELAKKERERVERLRIQREKQQRLEEAEERRQENLWELDGDCPDEGLMAHALLKFLDENNSYNILSEEDKVKKEEIKSEIERLQEEYDADENTRIDLLDEISDLEDQLSEFDDYIDVYNIVPIGDFHDMTRFKVVSSSSDDKEFAVGDTEDVESSCWDRVDNLIDELGYEGFSSSFVSGYIDDEEVESYARSMFEDDVYYSPQSYLSDEDRMLSRKQEEEIKVLEYHIQKNKETIGKLEVEIENAADDDDIFIEKAQGKIYELEESIEELESEIEDIQDNPDGDFPEDLMDEKIDDLVSDATYDSEGFIREHGLDMSNFINKNKFIRGVIDADGYGNTLNSYDGSEEEIYVQDKLFYVMRID